MNDKREEIPRSVEKRKEERRRIEARGGEVEK
jgi:hypothetical protein